MKFEIDRILLILNQFCINLNLNCQLNYKRFGKNNENPSFQGSFRFSFDNGELSTVETGFTLVEDDFSIFNYYTFEMAHTKNSIHFRLTDYVNHKQSQKLFVELQKLIKENFPLNKVSNTFTKNPFNANEEKWGISIQL